MRKCQEALLVLMYVLIYLVSAAYWEIALVKIVLWWGKQLIALRPLLNDAQSFFYTIVAIVFSTVVIPHFVWFPVLLTKELIYLLKEDEHAPYVARAAKKPTNLFSDSVRSMSRWLSHNPRLGLATR
jgi:hypothetical protein